MKIFKLTVAHLLFILSFVSNGQIAGIIPGQENINFHTQAYEYSTIYLKEIARITGVELPDSIKIVPPNLQKFDNVTVLIGLAEGMGSDELVICLAGNYNSEKVTYFIDHNQDRNFVNDGTAENQVKLRPWDPQKIMQLNTKSRLSRLMLIPPKEKKKSVDYRVRIQDKIAFSINIGVGTGDLTYQYDNLDFGYPTKYAVEVNEQNITTAVTYDFKKFNIGFSVAFQRHHYSASRLGIRMGEPNIQRIDNAFRDVNLSSHTLLDKHPKNRIQLGFFGTYKNRINKTVELQGRLKIGTVNYSGQDYISFYQRDLDRVYPARPIEYSLESDIFYEIAIICEITVGINQALFLEVARSSQRWEPVGFLNGLSQENFESKLKIIKANFGYRIAF